MSLRKSDLKFAVVATDVVTLAFVNDKLSVLLIEPNNPDYQNKDALIGGLILPDETAEQSVKRHLSGKGGVKPDYIEQLHTFTAINRDTRGRVISVAYLALIKPSKTIKISKNAYWKDINKIKSMAYDHKDILIFARKYLGEKIMHNDLIKHMLPKEFTLTQLQKAYEAILGEELDKRNFRKKILSLNWLKKTNKMSSGAHRPAELYTFII